MVDDVCGPLMAAGLHRKTGRPVTWLIAGGLTFGSEFHMSLNLASPRRAPVQWATTSATGSISQDGRGSPLTRGPWTTPTRAESSAAAFAWLVRAADWITGLQMLIRGE
ncbi:hypothetical protein CTAM01_10225 [Colletotrichum tamarilloi]|uniref:Uncharacterized protein n=1 Tax=Colletotrichum tamarilloi TaxID=1209934 RepID=A0ABQ9R150_9PEZI|nr:uncharacterized protein CTAM01_10225 [Colletotrichum tamarilloi]KAK1491902.1 hypothetical protein CTAM01_10225 [Colletotrichum tamarilloi]